MTKPHHGIDLDEKRQEQPTDKKRAQDSSSKKIPGSGRQNEDSKPDHPSDDREVRMDRSSRLRLRPYDRLAVH